MKIAENYWKKILHSITCLLWDHSRMMFIILRGSEDWEDFIKNFVKHFSQTSWRNDSLQKCHKHIWNMIVTVFCCMCLQTIERRPTIVRHRKKVSQKGKNSFVLFHIFYVVLLQQVGAVIVKVEEEREICTNRNFVYRIVYVTTRTLYL